MPNNCRIILNDSSLGTAVEMIPCDSDKPISMFALPFIEDVENHASQRTESFTTGTALRVSTNTLQDKMQTTLGRLKL